MADHSIDCWGPGGEWKGRECGAKLPDSKQETMRKNGWGFTYGVDPHSPSGIGPFYACPEHKDQETKLD